MATKKKTVELNLPRLVDSLCSFLDAYTEALKLSSKICEENEKKVNEATEKMIEKLLGPPYGGDNKPAPDSVSNAFTDLSKLFGKE